MLWVIRSVQLGDWLQRKDPATIKADFVVACPGCAVGVVFVWTLDDSRPSTEGACPWVKRQHCDLQAPRGQFWDDPPEGHVEVAAQKVDVVSSEDHGQLVPEEVVLVGEATLLFGIIVQRLSLFNFLKLQIN